MLTKPSFLIVWVSAADTHVNRNSEEKKNSSLSYITWVSGEYFSATIDMEYGMKYRNF